MSVALYPSLISADLLNLAQVIRDLDPHCAGHHIDVMDGHFVDNITWGPAFVNAIARQTSGIPWVHLMVTDPLKWIKRLEMKANSIVSFHFESKSDVGSCIKQITDNNWVASITINPNTNPAEIFHLLDVVGHVLVMSVHPGFSGQRFLDSALRTLDALVREREARELSFGIGIDGGVHEGNIRDVVAHGARDIACASALFSGDGSPVEMVKRLQGLI